MAKKTHTVRFLPEDRTAEVEEGRTLLEAAEAAGVYINSICGGDGVCGKCRVIVRKGNVDAEPTTFLTRDEIQAGYVLACRTRVREDVVLEVPPESRLTTGPQLTSEDAVRFGAVAPPGVAGTPYAFDPLCWQEYVELPRPDLVDNHADQERLYRELQRRRNVPVMQMGLAVLKQLSALARANEWRVTATLGKRGGTVEVMQIQGGDATRDNYGVAVDVGTTTVVAHLVHLKTGQTLNTQATYNSQIQYGEDVIARIQYASTRGKLARLGECVAQDINNLVAGFVANARIRLSDITYVVCAGNTTMMHLLLGLEAGNIRREPYVPAAAQPPVIRAAEAGVKINPRGLLAWLPAVSGYVGGDVVAGVLACGMNRNEELCLLIDLGTNGEIVVGNRDWLICCSASAGPAFEGGGITCGTRASRGAIEGAALAPGGEVVSLGVIGGGKPIGLCGSGMIDVVAEMLRVGVIDRTGAIREDPRNPRVRESGGQRLFVLVPAKETEHGRDIVVTEADLQTFIHSKGAIYHAGDCLLKHMGMTFADVARIYISGGFGNYLNIHKAMAIGLLPDLPAQRFKFIGNGSVQGAKMALLSQQAQAVAEETARGMTYFELSNDPEFMNNYSAALFLPHTDVERFPTVMQELAHLKHD